MDFDNIFPVVVILYLLLARFLRRQPQQAGPGKAVEKNSGLKLLRELLAGHISADGSGQRQAGPQKSSPPARATSPTSLKKKAEARAVRRQAVAPPAAPESGSGSLSARRPKRPRFGRNQLRRALIWSEVLAKPVALRDE